MDEVTGLPLAEVKAYAAHAGLRSRRIYPAKRMEHGALAVVPTSEAAYFDAAPMSYDFPEVTLTPLRNVVARGRSNILTTDDAILVHELLDFARDMPPEYFYGRLGLTDDRRNAAWKTYDPSKAHRVPEAAVFTDGTAPNYAHWLTEVLPRIAAFVQDRAFARTPLILDLDLHENIRRSLDLLAPDQAVYRLRPDDLARVGVLHHVSVTGYVPFAPQPREDLSGFCHGYFSAQALRRMVKQLRRAVNPPAGSRHKLFVRRTSTSRRLLNEAAIEEALVARGFKAIEPNEMSIEEQVAEFSRAQIVVGATGAAIANLIFAQPDCPIVVLMPHFRHLPYRYWSNMAVAAGAGPVVHVVGPQETVLPDPWSLLAPHQDFTVEVKDVLDGVDAAMALRP